MSLIHTCQLCGANSFDHLLELQRHAKELAARPADGCRETIARRRGEVLRSTIRQMRMNP
jgi:hypothetical protein